MKTKIQQAIIILSLNIIAISSCRKNADEPQVPPFTEEQAQGEITFSRIQNSILTTNCAISGCHAGTSPQQGMNLSQSLAYNMIVNVRSQENPSLFRIEPGNPDRSYLYLKIIGHSSITGIRMPANGPPYLSNQQIALVRQWISDGAQNN